jgi:hypothetical protein
MFFSKIEHFCLIIPKILIFSVLAIFLGSCSSSSLEADSFIFYKNDFSEGLPEGEWAVINSPQLEPVTEVINIKEDFDSLNTALWEQISRGTKITIANGILELGRDTSNRDDMIGISTPYFPKQSYLAKIDFRIPRGKSHLTFRLTSGEGSYFSVLYDSDKYSLDWSEGREGEWGREEIDSWGDEKSNFHTMTIIYNSTNGEVSGYIDRYFLGSAFVALSSDLKFEITASRSPSDDTLVLLDNFYLTTQLGLKIRSEDGVVSVSGITVGPGRDVTGLITTRTFSQQPCTIGISFKLPFTDWDRKETVQLALEDSRGYFFAVQYSPSGYGYRISWLDSEGWGSFHPWIPAEGTEGRRFQPLAITYDPSTQTARGFTSGHNLGSHKIDLKGFKVKFYYYIEPRRGGSYVNCQFDDFMMILEEENAR